jgi:hypothetical protein
MQHLLTLLPVCLWNSWAALSMRDRRYLRRSLLSSMTTQGFVAITLAIASANIHGIAYAAPWCHPGDKVTITAIIGDVKGNLIHLKPESSRPCRINAVVGGVRGNKNAQKPSNCTAGRTIHATGIVDTLAGTLYLNPTSISCKPKPPVTSSLGHKRIQQVNGCASTTAILPQRSASSDR